MGFNAYHNSHDVFYREPFGAVECGQTIAFRLNTSSSVPVKTCVLRFWINDQEITIPMEQDGDRGSNIGLFKAQYSVPDTPGLMWYYFIIEAESQIFYYGNNCKRMGGEGKLWDQDPPSYQITVYKPMVIPAWYLRGVMYQIFVDRFYQHKPSVYNLYPRKNALLHANWSDSPVYVKDDDGRVTDWDFFGGNLQGVIEKLTYFKELGINILYLNPIFDAPSNHKYDTADYHRIDPMYGDDEVFKQLIDRARENGISIILDGVFSHTGSDSIYFNKYGNYPGVGAYQGKDSPFSNWYPCQPNDPEYPCWWGVDSLPEVNEMDPSYRQFIYGSENSVIKKWLKLGISGWRLDVADELPDQFIKEFRQAQKSISPQSVLIGEVWEDASNKVSYGKQRGYFLGDELDATMNYPFRISFLRFILGLSDSSVVHQEIMSILENYPRENFYAELNLIGSHDTVRILNLLGDAPPEQSLTKTEQRNFRLCPNARKLAVKRLKLLSLVQMTFPGVPCIYYGDEAGIEGYADPFNRGTYPWGKEDREILTWYQRILRLRAEYEVLQTGDFESFYLDQDVYGFIRSGNDEEIIILINRHLEKTKTVNLTRWQKSYALIIDLINGERIAPDTFAAMPIEALSGRALFCKKTLPAKLIHQRSCGVLMHISSLPSAWGLGDLGQEAYDFVDFLSEAGQSLWQVLPLNPAGVGDCPYQSESVFAGNTMFISLDHLIDEGLLNLEETRSKFAQVRNFSLRPSLLLQALKKLKQSILREAYQKFIDQLNSNPKSKSTFLSLENYDAFQQKNKYWLDDYVLFRALKAYFGEVPWYNWEPEIAWRKSEILSEFTSLLQDEMGFIQFLQYAFYYEWDQLKTYSTNKGVQLIGDIPHFVAADSCDVWVNRKLFVLDEDGRPAKTAGVPPDYFSKTGQSWGNPVYNWDALAITQYDWWKKRLQFGQNQFDYLRLDHFRGFEAYWEIDAGEETAVNGRWLKGPGKRFFESIIETLGECPIIVEDLGIITTEVDVLKKIFGFSGMRVLQFTPLEEIPKEEDTNFIYYSGTHDNNTLLGWYEKNKGNTPNGSEADQITQSKQACRDLIEGIYQSQADWVILPMQDILGLNEKARMNIPGTIHGNWLWQLERNLPSDDLKTWLSCLAETTLRMRNTGK
jgi:4-alpha-glucanotransferase